MNSPSVSAAILVALCGLLCRFAAPEQVAAQPRTEAARSLDAAVEALTPLVDRGEYVLAIQRLQSALDSADVGVDRSDALFLMARASFLAGRFHPAAQTARRLLAAYPDFVHADEALYIAAISEIENDHPEDAEPALRRLSALDSPRGGAAHYWLARLAADRGSLDTALDLLEPAIEAPPHEFSDDAHYLRGWIAEGRDSLSAAAADYRTILDDFPDSDLRLDAQLRLGVIDARRGQYESAITLLQSLTPQTDRQREERLFYLGESSAALGRQEQALEYFTEHLREFPTSTRNREARYGAGYALLKLQRWAQAITTFGYLQDGVDSIAAAASYQIAAIEINQGDTASAVRTLHSLLHRLPYESFSDNANYLMGRIQYRREKYDSARHYLLIAARQFPESEIRPESYYLLAESYNALDNYDNAQYNFARVRAVGATGALYYRSLLREAVMLYHLGRFYSGVNRLREYVGDDPDGPDIEEAIFWLGESLYQHGAYDEAERYFQQHVDRFANTSWSAEALYGLAWAEFRQKKFRESADAFEQFLKRYPESDHAVDATIRLADDYRYLKQYDKAIATYESVGGSAATGARAEEARFRLAQALYEMGEVDRSVGAFKALVHDFPKSKLVDVYAFNIGQIYREQGRDSLALAQLDTFVDDYGQSRLMPQALFTIGDIHYDAMRYDTAYAYYRRVLDEYPASPVVPDALNAVRYALEAMGRGREAVDVIDEFEKKNPSRLPADSLTMRKAEILFSQGDYDAAIAMYRSLIDQNPSSGLHPDALYQIARTYSLFGKRDSALMVYRDVVETFPESEAAAQALVDRGNLLMKLDRPAAAAADFQGFLERFPGRQRATEASYGLGAAMLAQADTAAAEAQWRGLIDSAAVDEDDIFVDRGRLALAQLVASRGDREEALDLLAHIVSRRLDYVAAEALLVRARLLMQANDLSGALAELRRLTTDFDTYTEYSEPGMLLLGELHEKLTNYDAARQTYTQLAEKTNQDSIREEAEARLRRLKGRR